jgi:hypothetical protein
MRFSQRIGKTPIKNTLQIETIDEPLNNRLWNAILENFLYKLNDNNDYGLSDRELICKVIWIEFYGQRVDLIPSSTYSDVSSYGVIEYIKDWFFTKALWYEKFDLIEFLAKGNLSITGTFVEKVNHSLKREVSGYRVIDSKIVQITSEEEINAIEEALQPTNQIGVVSTHLSAALDFLTNRKTPDYRNSIKESVSAVEAICKIITQDNKASLGKALAIIETKYQLHSSLKEAYSKLYGYTSDANGIRHSLLEDGVSIEFEDAKFMLVSCSAFINYLKTKLKV